MVTFICENCDKTLKKNQVDRHFSQCRYPPRLVCIDCSGIFCNYTHTSHISCISEQEKTFGQYYKPPKKAQKEQKNNDINKNGGTNDLKSQNNEENKEQIEKNGEKNKKTQENEEKNNICLIEEEKTLEKANKEQKICEKSNNTWKGWKKTIRKNLQRNGLKRNLKDLEREVVADFLEKNPGYEKTKAEKIFHLKLKNNKFRVNIEKGKVTFVPKSER